MDSEARLRREFERLQSMLKGIVSEPYDPNKSSSREVSPEGVKLYNRIATRYNREFPHDELILFREDTTPNLVTHPKCLEILSQVELALDVLKGGAVEARLEVSPIFTRRDFRSPPTELCFVLMPFREELKPIYDDHIKKVIAEFGLECLRADDFFNVSSIIEDMWENIFVARLMIADLTGKNPNVFYEVGVAHALGKNVILITQSIDDVPFDLRHLRHIQYEYTPRGMREFEEQLRQTVTTVLGQT